MTRILLVRHGETDWNAEGRWQGHSDRSLDDAGRAQAQLLAAHLAHVGIDLLYSSDLARARETAAAVEAATGLEARIDPDLREVDVGGLTGCSRVEVEARDPAWFRTWLEGAVAGYPDGETYLDVHRRSVRAFERVLREAAGGTAAVVCHGGNIRAITLEVVGMGSEHADERWRIGPVGNCSITAVERRHGRVSLVTFNETGHLD
jgi:glucosyl-3-phosphoglycerate phosphatase